MWPEMKSAGSKSSLVFIGGGAKASTQVLPEIGGRTWAALSPWFIVRRLQIQSGRCTIIHLKKDTPVVQGSSGGGFGLRAWGYHLGQTSVPWMSTHSPCWRVMCARPHTAVAPSWDWLSRRHEQVWERTWCGCLVYQWWTLWRLWSVQRWPCRVLVVLFACIHSRRCLYQRALWSVRNCSKYSKLLSGKLYCVTV